MLSGGVLTEIAAVMPLDALRARFEDKGRFRPVLEATALDRIVAPFAALRGAAIAYCD
jgi:glucokinase